MVMAVTGAAIDVTSTVIGVGADVVGTTAEIAVDGVKALTESSDEE